MKNFRSLRYLIFRLSIPCCITSVNFIKIGWLEIEYQQIKDFSQILFTDFI